MVDPTSQDLYVMQNEFGLIKIGRSLDCVTRLYNLRQTERCHIEIIAIYANAGADEETIHIALDDYRLFGEWFAGDDEARAAIEAEITPPEPLAWRFAYDEAGAEAWFNHMQVVRDASYISKAIHRQITILREAVKPSHLYDGRVAWALEIAATGEHSMVVTLREGETLITRRGQTLIPAYTASIENALLAWPEDIRPASWDGTAIECCIAALQAVRARLPKVPRAKDWKVE